MDSSGTRVIHPRSVAARLVRMVFRLVSGNESSHASDDRVLTKEIPSSFDTYQVKALVSRLFQLPAYGFRLIWETDEWDPVQKAAVDDADWDADSEDEDQSDRVEANAVASDGIETSRFIRREVELVDSTRDIGFLFQDQVGEIRIRVAIIRSSPS